MAINYKFRKRTTVFTQLYLPSGTPTPATFARKDWAQRTAKNGTSVGISSLLAMVSQTQKLFKVAGKEMLNHRMVDEWFSSETCFVSGLK